MHAKLFVSPALRSGRYLQLSAADAERDLKQVLEEAGALVSPPSKKTTKSRLPRDVAQVADWGRVKQGDLRRISRVV
jgi:hypothetical protein